MQNHLRRDCCLIRLGDYPVSIIGTVLVILIAALLTGCASNPFHYSSYLRLAKPIDKPYRITVSIDAPANRISGKLNNAAQIDLIKKAIIKDIQDNIFLIPMDSQAVEITVSVRIHELQYSRQPWGLLWVPFTFVGAPDGKAIGKAEVELRVQDEDGEVLASYTSKQKLGKWYNQFHYNRGAIWFFGSGVTPTALRFAMEDIKRQIEADQSSLISKIEGSTSGETRMMVSSQEHQSSWEGSKLAVAIANLESESLESGDVAIITNLLQEELWRSGRFEVLERERTEAVITELGFQMSGCTETSCAAQIGRALNVEEMVVGSLEKLGEMYIIAIRFVNVESITVTLAESYRFRGSIEGLPDAVEKLVSSILPHFEK